MRIYLLGVDEDVFKDFKDINNPCFENISHVHNWRNYVPIEWKERWSELTEQEKKIIVILCSRRASSEEWD